MKNIVLLAYGKEIEFQRAIISILSFCAWNNSNEQNVRIICFTDQPAYFKKYLVDVPVEFRILTPTRLQDMLGGTQYIHRRKICVLQEVSSSYPEDDLYFLDSDTFFIADSNAFLTELKSGTSLMHEKEYRLIDAPEIYKRFMSKKLNDAEEFPLAFNKLIEENTFVLGTELAMFSSSQSVWNSGVLGLSKETFPLISDILTLSDRFFAETKWFISEQLAFGLSLQHKTNLVSSVGYVNHYHQCKSCVDPLLIKMLNEKFESLSLIRKLAMVRRFSLDVNKLTIFDKSSSISIGALKKRNFKKGIKFAIKAVKSIPLNHQIFMGYVKSRIDQLK